MSKENCSPAFPVKDGVKNHLGITLRDYFAAKALQGMLADLPNIYFGIDWIKNTANGAYELADAMLEARK